MVHDSYFRRRNFNILTFFKTQGLYKEVVLILRSDETNNLDRTNTNALWLILKMNFSGTIFVH